MLEHPRRSRVVWEVEEIMEKKFEIGLVCLLLASACGTDDQRERTERDKGLVSGVDASFFSTSATGPVR